MSQDSPLLLSALTEARLTSEADVERFWQKPLGKSPALRKRYIKDMAAPLSSSVIFYETMSGSRIGDNPYGIFEYLRAHPERGEFLHVWSIDAHAEIPEQYEDCPDVVFVRRDTHAYTYFLATAAYVICNANLPAFFIRRNGQKYLNTWHGIPYKALGRHAPRAKFGSPAGNATFTKATHILTPCEFTSDKIMSAYSMHGVSTANIAEIGYPRVDRTVAPEPGLTAHLRSVLGLTDSSTEDSRPVVLYAPTWRAEGGKDTVDTDQLIDDLTALAKLDVQLMYRGHHRMDRMIRDSSIGDQIGEVIIPPHDISSNDLLTVVDILITDFSSIFFDFLPTGRPIVHYVYDLEGYAQTRGVNLDVDELPGDVVTERTQMQESVMALSRELARCGTNHDHAQQPLQGEPYVRAQERFCPYEDGSASQRAVEFLFDESTGDHPVRSASDGRPTAAFWAGDLRPGPKADEFIGALLASAASPLEQTVLVIERTAPIAKDALAKIRKLRDAISTYAYTADSPAVLPEEEYTFAEFATQGYLNPQAAQRLVQKSSMLHRIFSHEYRRRLDDAQFDRVFVSGDLRNEELAIATFASNGPVIPVKQWSAPRENAADSRGRASAGRRTATLTRRSSLGSAYLTLRTRLFAERR